jgi:NUMOD3 motif
MPDILAILVSERDKLNRAIEAFGGEVSNAIVRLTKSAAPGKRTVSPEARAKMAAAQKARWANVKVTPRKRGPVKMSDEAKAKISKAMKARWAARKKNG